MVSFFQQKNIFLIVITAILVLYISDIALLIFFGKNTDGEVIGYVHNYASGPKYPSISYPVIQYQINEEDHQFNGNWEAPYRTGDSVRVIYRPFWPRKARIYTFWGVGKKPLIQFVAVSILWWMIYSSFKPKVKRKR